MGAVELFLIGVGLSMDAFAVAVCKGLSMRRIDWGYAVAIAVAFGGFQALMPFLGWALGMQFAELIAPIDHWVAFVLLAFIGGKMLVEALRDDGCAGEGPPSERGKWVELLLLAVATSIDALAVGVTFAFLDVGIGRAVCIIGITTFCLSFLGVAVGNRFGSRFERRAQVVGGVVLVAIGVKILVEHLLG